MKFAYSIAFSLPFFALPSLPSMAADLSLKLELPQLNVAEYHRPYVALWLEKADQTFAGNLAIWYDMKKKDQGGTKWLKDMRQWWRKSGRELNMPVDGVSAATRAPGEHVLQFSGSKTPLDKLPAGDYQVVVEVVREAGGRELLRLPFQWPAQKPQNQALKGKEELGNVALQIKP